MGKTSSSEILLPSRSEGLALSEDDNARGLMRCAAALRYHGFGNRVTYSRKVFIPLTPLCRDSCHYCTFARPPRRGGGTLMNESISRAAGAAHGEELPPEQMDAIIASLGRRAEQRTTLYKRAPAELQSASYASAPLSPVIQTPATRHARLGGRHSAALV